MGFANFLNLITRPLLVQAPPKNDIPPSLPLPLPPLLTLLALLALTSLHALNPTPLHFPPTIATPAPLIEGVSPHVSPVKDHVTLSLPGGRRIQKGRVGGGGGRFVMMLT